ncbi:sodium/proline symporter PutP [Endozoicomonas sp. 8E]|uniref:sodium/proline symporter PutP n=1 Tax=Endozoicomonas sp. 8E TaxID=3035692 RepID=UPI002939525B|nr:sodium/proline symporter PutP [Endozoicomonas sp. 8E]WOG26330.1 sodium/proline symporter PutP [Endozoicomonas sp. 8E]
MPEGNLQIILTFLVYFTVMLGVGYIAWQRTLSSADYFLGGRSLGPWSAALSAGASDMSGWLLLGLPGYAFAAGLEAFWLAAGLLGGTWLNWLIVARRLRVYSVVADDSLTLPEYFASRFEDHKGLLQPISAAFILIFFLFYTSSGLVAGGKLFESVFGIDYEWAVVIGMLSVISYTLFGGFLAVCWTDLIQGLLMAAALLIVPVAALEVSGGVDQVFVEIGELNPELLNLFTTSEGQTLSLITIFSLLGWGLGYFGQPHILARFKAVQSSDQLTLARRIAVSWTGICMLGALMVGLAGIVYTQRSGIQLDDPEAIFMLMVNTLFHPVIAGILLAAILAAIMSTADSQLLVCSTAFAEDFYRDLFKVGANAREVLLVGRLAVVGIAVIATWLAMNPDSSVLAMVSYAWAGLGAAFGPALLLSLYWKRMTGLGAMAGIVTGAVTVLIWKPLTGGLFDLYEIIPGFVISMVACILFSFLGRQPSRDMIERFEKVESRTRTVSRVDDEEPSLS